MNINNFECTCSFCGNRQVFLRVLTDSNSDLISMHMANFCSKCGKKLESEDIIWDEVKVHAGIIKYN